MLGQGASAGKASMSPSDTPSPYIYIPAHHSYLQALSAFLTKTRLSRYAEKRNDPTVPDALSGLSPYLHFGHLAPQVRQLAARKLAGSWLAAVIGLVFGRAVGCSVPLAFGADLSRLLFLHHMVRFLFRSERPLRLPSASRCIRCVGGARGGVVVVVCVWLVGCCVCGDGGV